MRLSVDADASLAGILSIYMSGGELGRFTNAGMALGTPLRIWYRYHWWCCSGRWISHPEYDPRSRRNHNTDIALTGQSVVRATNGIRSVVNDNGIFTWSVGGNNYAAGLAGSTEYMRLNCRLVNWASTQTHPTKN